MTKWTIGALGVLSLLLVGCGMLSPDQATAVEGGLRDLHASGQITTEQLTAALQMLAERTMSTDWYAIGAAIGSTALAFLGVPIVIAKQRGPATQKVGLPAEQVAKLAREISAEANKAD